MASKQRARRETKDKVLRPVRPSAAITAEYQRKLDRLIDEMNRSVTYFLKASYRANEPVTVSMDESSTEALKRTIRDLAKRWLRRFDEAAEGMAEWFSQSVEKRSTEQLKKILRDGGISVPFVMTPAMKEIQDATVSQNVSLIKSIPSQYFTEIEGMVARSVQTGRDMGQLSSDLQQRFGITKRRAALISRTQNEMATAAFNKARLLEAGVTEAQWVHSGGGKTQRKTHVKAGRDKVRFDVALGWYDPDPKVSRHIQAGELINCFPAETVLKFGQDVKKAFRAWFDGELTDLVMETGETLAATPNHPVLTPNGWVAIGSLKEGDYVVHVSQESIKAAVDEGYGNEVVTRIVDAFDAVSSKGLSHVSLGADFHGDLIEGNVDVVFVDDPLSFGLKPRLSERFDKLPLATSDLSGFGLRPHKEFFVASLGASNGVMSGLGEESATIGANPFHPDGVSFAGSSALDAMISKDAIDNSAASSTTKTDCDGEFALARVIGRDNGLLIQTGVGVGRPAASHAIGDINPSGFEMTAESVGTYADHGSDFSELSTLKYQLVRVVDNRRRSFSGHVYTLETECGWFAVSNAAILTKNCRCVQRAVVRGFS